MARDSGMCVCGMHACGKCAPMIAIFGLIFLVAGLGIFTASWFNGWTILGVFMALWGGSLMMKGG